MKALQARNQALSLPFQKYDVNHASGSSRWTSDEQYANGSWGPPEALAIFKDGLVGDLVEELRTCDASRVERAVGFRHRKADRDEDAILLGVRKDMLKCDIADDAIRSNRLHFDSTFEWHLLLRYGYGDDHDIC